MAHYFRINDEASRSRLLMLLAMIAETKLYGEPCPLFYSQLNEIQVLIDRAEREILKLRKDKDL